MHKLLGHEPVEVGYGPALVRATEGFGGSNEMRAAPGLKAQTANCASGFLGKQRDPDALVVGGDISTTSFYLQGGYFIRPEKVEIAGRYSRIYVDGDGNDQSEVAVGVNVFSWGHRLKWQAAYSYYDFERAADNLFSHRFVAQAQLWF